MLIASNITQIVPSNGPAAGGNIITIVSSTAIGNGSDITQVLVGGISTFIVSQTNLSVAVIAPAFTPETAVNISVTSAHYGNSSILNGYFFNAGMIKTSCSCESFGMY